MATLDLKNTPNKHLIDEERDISVLFSFPDKGGFQLAPFYSGIATQFVLPQTISGYPGFLVQPSETEFNTFAQKSVQLHKLPIQNITNFIAQVLQFLPLAGLYSLNTTWFVKQIQSQEDRSLIHKPILYLWLAYFVTKLGNTFIQASKSIQTQGNNSDLLPNQPYLIDVLYGNVDMNTFCTYLILGLHYNKYLLQYSNTQKKVITMDQTGITPLYHDTTQLRTYTTNVLFELLDDIKESYELYLSLIAHNSESKQQVYEKNILITLKTFTPRICSRILQYALEEASYSRDSQVVDTLKHIFDELNLDHLAVNLDYNPSHIMYQIQNVKQDILGS